MSRSTIQSDTTRACFCGKYSLVLFLNVNQSDFLSLTGISTCLPISTEWAGGIAPTPRRSRRAAQEARLGNVG